MQHLSRTPQTHTFTREKSDAQHKTTRVHLCTCLSRVRSLRYGWRQGSCFPFARRRSGAAYPVAAWKRIAACHLTYLSERSLRWERLRMTVQSCQMGVPHCGTRDVYSSWWRLCWWPHQHTLDLCPKLSVKCLSPGQAVRSHRANRAHDVDHDHTPATFQGDPDCLVIVRCATHDGHRDGFL